MPQDQEPQVTLEDFEERRRKHYGLPKGLTESLKTQESGGRQYDQSGGVLTSPKQARGRYQVLKSTAAQYALDPDDPFENVEASFRYLSELHKKVDAKVADPGERWAQTLAGYHAGEGRLREVNKTGSLPSTSDGMIRTDEYVSDIMGRWQRYDQERSGQQTAQLGAAREGADSAINLTGPEQIQVPTLGQTRQAMERKTSPRARQATSLAQSVEGGKRRAVELFKRAGELERRDPALVATEPGLPGRMARPIFGAEGKPFRQSEILRARAEAELETANRLAEDARRGYSDLLEAGFGADTDPRQLSLRPEQRRRWAYVKPKNGEVRDLLFTRRLGESSDRRTERGLRSLREAAGVKPSADALARQRERQELEPLVRRGDIDAEARLAANLERVETGAPEDVGTAENVFSRFMRGLTGSAGSTLTGASMAPLGDLETAMGMQLAEERAEKARGTPVSFPRPGEPEVIAQAARDAEQLREWSERTFPVDPRIQPSYNPLKKGFWAATLPEAAGLTAPMIAAGALSGPAAPYTMATMGATQNAGQTYADAKAAGASDEEARAAAGIGALIGTSEAFGLGRMLARMGLARPALKRVGEIVKEYGQEAGASWANELNAAIFSGYDPTRDTSFFSPKVQGEGLIGAIFGVGAQGLDAGAGRLRSLRGVRSVRAEQRAPLDLAPTTIGPTELISLREAAAKPEFRKRLDAANEQARQADEAAAPQGDQFSAAIGELESYLSPTGAEAKKVEKEAQKQAELDERAAREAEGEIKRMRLYDEAVSAAQTASEEADAMIEAGDLSNAISKLRARQKALQESVKYLPETPEAVRTKANIAEIVEGINTSIPDLRRQALKAGRETEHPATLRTPAAEASPKRSKAEQSAQERKQRAETGQRVADRYRERAQAALASGRILEAHAAFRAELQALNDVMKITPADDFGRRTQLRNSITTAERDLRGVSGELKRGEGKARPSQKTVDEDAPTADLPGAPLLNSIVNPEGGVPAAPESASGVFGALARKQERGGGEAQDNVRLINRIRQLGGINPAGVYAGELQSAVDKRYPGLINRKDGVKPDTLIEYLVEEGYPVDRDELDSLFRAIDSDIAGKAVYPLTRGRTADLEREEAEYYARLAEEEGRRDGEMGRQGEDLPTPHSPLSATVRRPTERRVVPQVTPENIDDLRNRREELSRFRYDRAGDLTHDLADEYRELGSRIAEFENEQAKAERGGRIEVAPPPGRDDRPFAQPTREHMSRAFEAVEARLTEEAARVVEVLPRSDTEALDRSVAAVNLLFADVAEDVDALDLLDRAIEGDEDARREFIYFAERSHGVDADTIDSILDARRFGRESERGHIRKIAQARRGQGRAEAGAARHGGDRSFEPAGSQTRALTGEDLETLNQSPEEVADEDFDQYLRGLESLNNDRIRGLVDMPEWATRQLEARLKQANDIRRGRVKEKRLGAKNAPLPQFAKPLSKTEGGRRLVEQVKDKQAGKEAEEASTVAHPNPEIDRKPILAETNRGTVIVPNPNNKTGISEVKDRSDEPAEHKFSSTQVDLPPEIAEQIVTFGKRIPDADLADDGRETEPHITVKYGLHGWDPKFVEQAFAGEGPAVVTFGKVSLFTTNPDFDVVKVDIVSPDLHRLNKKIAESQPITDTHPTYKPHATIAYVKKGRGARYVGNTFLEGKTITLDAVTFSGRAGERVDIPLTGKSSTGAIPAGAMPELREPTAPPSPLAQTQNPALSRTAARIDYRIPDEAMPELRDRPKPAFVLEAEERLRQAATGQLAGSGARQLLDLAISAGWKVYRAGMRFFEWTQAAVAEAGDRGAKIRPYLREVWERIRAKPGRAEARYSVDDIPTQPGLSPEDRAVETRFREYLANNFDEAVRRYRAKYGKKIDADEVRELSADYRASDEARARYGGATRAPAWWFADHLFDLMLAESPKAGEKPLVLLTAGGSGAGKSSALQGSNADEVRESQIQWDSALVPAEDWIKRIDKALAAGKKVAVAAVYRDPADAYRNGVLPRAMTTARGRVTSVERFMRLQSAVRDSLEAVQARYEGDPRVSVVFIDNTRGQDNAAFGSFDIFQPVTDHEALRRQLIQVTEEAYANGEISRPIYDSALEGTGAEGRPPRADLHRGRGEEAGRGARGESQQERARRSEETSGPEEIKPDRGGGSYLGSGLGSLQPLFDKPKTPKAPQSKVPLPKDWNLSKWADKAVAELDKIEKAGKLSKRRRDKFAGAIADVIKATKEGDGEKLFLARERLAKMSAGEFTISDLAGAPRTIKAGLDLSFAYRQGGAYNYPGLFLRPIQTIKRIGRAFAAMKEGNYGRLNAQIAAHPRAEEMRASGLHLSNQRKIEGDNKLNDREEGYIARFMQDVPGYKQSERANTTLLDTLRVDVFDRYARYLEKHAVTFKKKPEAFKQMAEFVNLMTGRGSLGAYDNAIPFLSLLMFSPRWVASRVQLLNRLANPASYRRIDPQVRKLMWRDLGSYAGAMGLTLGLLAAAGAYGLAQIKVGDDPDESNFGKVVINGKYHYDLLGGLMQYLVFGWRLARGVVKRERGEDLKESEKPENVIARFARSKASPAAGFAANALTGKDFRGQPISLGASALDLVYPLIAKDFMEGYNVEGGSLGEDVIAMAKEPSLQSLRKFAGNAARSAGAQIPSLLGVGYSPYEEGGQAAKAPSVAEEARKYRVYFGERRIEGEPADLQKARAARRKGLVEEYGPALIGSQVYKDADGELKAKMLDTFARRTNDLANERDPDLDRLDPDLIFESIRKYQRSAEKGRERRKERLIYSPEE